VSTTAHTIVVTTRQNTVDAMRLLPEGHTNPSSNVTNMPKDSPKLDGWFDVNEYFSVLNHLSMQPGYVLDYVYNNSGSGGQPYLYARRVDSIPFSTVNELYNTYIDKTIGHTYDYMAYIKTDDTEESFFQYVTLRIMGGQFYLWWHANYNDDTIICDATGLEAILSVIFWGKDITSEVKSKARKLNLAPVVELKDDLVIVRVITFTKWGGFIEETYIINRLFPHVIKDLKTQILVPWECGVMF